MQGCLVLLLITKSGQAKSVIVSSIIFAVSHWFNSGLWGNLSQMMMIVFAFTFAMELLLAYSYARTFSLLLPFAIHYGWNQTQNYIFPDTATGNHIFTLASPPTVTISYLAFFTMLLLPRISVLIADYLIVKNHRKV